MSANINIDLICIAHKRHELCNCKIHVGDDCHVLKIATTLQGAQCQMVKFVFQYTIIMCHLADKRYPTNIYANG